MPTVVTFEEITGRILKVFPDTRKVVLFGSRARGTYVPDSDFDVLVVAPTSLRPAERSALLRHALRGLDASFDLIVVTPEEFERASKFKSGVVAQAIVHGKVLHEAA